MKQTVEQKILENLQMKRMEFLQSELFKLGLFPESKYASFLVDRINQIEKERSEDILNAVQNLSFEDYIVANSVERVLDSRTTGTVASGSNSLDPDNFGTAHSQKEQGL